ncbi:MAG TPA: 30S ribosome-binding factor RbfA [Methylovirgula sp.]
MSRVHQQGGEPSQRMLRVGELIRHSLSDLLTRGAIMDPVLQGHVVTIPDVRMSPDLKHATIYVVPLGGKDAKEVIDALEKNRKFIRGEIAHRVNLKFAPELRFRSDDSFEYGSKIDAIFDSPEVKRDLASPVETETDDER